MATALEPGRIIAARYRVESQLGEGGMGSVYLVKHVHTDESLALKVLHAQVLRDESAVERFRREARAPAKIASEHVARVTDADTAPDLDNAPFYVMELLRGRDLERIVTEDGPLAPALVVEYLRQAARALDKAHAIGIIHRDLKPENLFLTTRDDGSPCLKLLDFGIARLADHDAPSHLRTQAGYIFGTPMYMSPEQTIGNVDGIAPATDVWAIGLVAFKLLLGREYWTATSTAQLCAAILAEPIVPPSARGSTFGPGFDAWFLRCVNREIGDRFQTAGETVAALAEALAVRIARPSVVSSAVIAAAQPAAGVDVMAPTFGLAQPPAAQLVPSAPPPPFAAPSFASPAAPAGSSTRSTLVIGAIGVACVVGLGAAVFGYFFAVRGKPVTTTGIVAVAPSASSVASGASPSASPLPEPALAAAAPPDSAEPAPRASTPKIARGGGGGATGAALDPAGGAKGAAGAPKDPPSSGSLSRDQRRRLDALQRLCDQGTFTPAECATKRAAIQRGDN